MSAALLWGLLTSRESFAQAVSAAVADCVSSLCLYPIDYVKLRCQADSSLQPLQVARDAGLSGLYRGIGGKMVQSGQQKMQYFYVSSVLKQLLKLRGVRLSASGNLFLGYVSALEGLATTMPLEATNMRMVATSKGGGGGASGEGFAATLGRIARTEGVLSFYKSISASTVLCVNPAITYGVFEVLKGWLLRRRGLRGVTGAALTTFEAFAAGVISKIIATTLTFPAIRAKVLINTRKKRLKAGGGGAEEADEAGLVGTIREVVAAEGVGGLYIGLQPQMLKAVLNAALMLTAKERIYAAVNLLLLPPSKAAGVAK